MVTRPEPPPASHTDTTVVRPVSYMYAHSDNCCICPEGKEGLAGWTSVYLEEAVTVCFTPSISS